MHTSLTEGWLAFFSLPVAPLPELVLGSDSPCSVLQGGTGSGGDSEAAGSAQRPGSGSPGSVEQGSREPAPPHAAVRAEEAVSSHASTLAVQPGNR